MDKNRRLRIIISVLLFPALIMSWLIYTAIREGFDVSNEILPEYNNLFTKEGQNKLRTPITFKDKIKGPQTNYILEGRFHVSVFKIKLETDKKLNELIDLKNQHTSRSFDVDDPIVDNSFFEMIAYSDKIDLVSDVDLSYEGEPVKTIAKNDGITCYYLKIETFSLSFNSNSINDIWGHSKGSDKIPISIAFIKKGKVVYCLLLAIDKGKQEFQPNLLYSLIKK
jgi:hypothetical protein